MKELDANNDLLSQAVSGYGAVVNEVSSLRETVEKTNSNHKVLKNDVKYIRKDLETHIGRSEDFYRSMDERMGAVIELASDLRELKTKTDYEFKDIRKRLKFLEKIVWTTAGLTFTYLGKALIALLTNTAK